MKTSKEIFLFSTNNKREFFRTTNKSIDVLTSQSSVKSTVKKSQEKKNNIFS